MKTFYRKSTRVAGSTGLAVTAGTLFQCVVLAWLALAVQPVAAQGKPLTFLNFTNPASVAGGEFGWSVAAVGTDRIVIGALSDDTGAPKAGAAYLFSTNGTLLTTFANPTPSEDDYFGRSVAALGTDRVLIGAYLDDTSVKDAGSVYLFKTNGTLLTTFTNPAAASAYFGHSVTAVGTDRVLIGACLADQGATDAGAAYLFHANGQLLLTFTNPTPESNDEFGRCVAALGTDRVLIGAPGDNTGARATGAAYLFSTSGNLLRTFTNPKPADGDQFGWSLAAVGTDRVLIGAYRKNIGAPFAGAAYLFDTTGALLTTFTNLIPTSARFGESVAAVGIDRVVIGAPFDSAGAGAAHLFTTTGTLLTVFANPSAAESGNFGGSVAVVGTDLVLVGAWRNNPASAFLFNIDSIPRHK